MENKIKNIIVDIVAKNLYNNLAAFMSNEIFVREAGFGQPDGTYAIHRHKKEELLKLKRSEWGDENQSIHKSNTAQKAKIIAEEIMKELEINGVV